jgi:hypothetical protein
MISLPINAVGVLLRALVGEGAVAFPAESGVWVVGELGEDAAFFVEVVWVYEAASVRQAADFLVRVGGPPVLGFENPYLPVPCVVVLGYLGEGERCERRKEYQRCEHGGQSCLCRKVQYDKRDEEEGGVYNKDVSYEADGTIITNHEIRMSEQSTCQ